jgi:hypothetical protein
VITKPTIIVRRPRRGCRAGVLLDGLIDLPGGTGGGLPSGPGADPPGGKGSVAMVETVALPLVGNPDKVLTKILLKCQH